MCIGISRTLEVWLHHGDLNRVRGYNPGTHRLTLGFMKFALTESFLISLFQKFEDTKWLIRSRKSKRSLSNRQHNDQNKITNNNLQNITQKNRDRATQTPLKPDVNSGAPEGPTVPSAHVVSVVLLLLQIR